MLDSRLPSSLRQNAMEHDIVIVGAGMVGVCCALELQRRGARVTLIDRRAPGLETSFGNAGCFARSSIVPFNNPMLRHALPKLLRNNTPQFRYRPAYLLREARWALSFLAHSRTRIFTETATALDQLIQLSTREHLRMMADAGITGRLRENGWLFLYRSEAGYASSAFSQKVYREFGIDIESVDAAGVQALEPSLAPLFPRGLWIKDSRSVDNPGAVVAAYAALFQARGGRIEQADVTAVQRQGRQWCVTADARHWQAAHVVVALGPWAKALFARIGLTVPMAFERGYHRHFGAQPGATLHRPIYDTAAGYVMAPMEMGLRLSSGVELNECDAPARPVQMALIETSAREAFPLGEALQSAPWMGRRPTLPDSRPMIGAVPGRDGLWCAFGHQHIGFSTGTGTAILLGALMHGETPPINATPFAPSRFL
nr:FAD-binding oxidoreductase [Robbsia andropogonis]